MTDPLCIASSITGLISRSSQLVSVLYSVSTPALDAKDSINRLLNEIQSLDSILAELQRLQPDITPIVRRNLATILDDCSRVYSEIEFRICEWSGLSGLSKAVGINISWEHLDWPIIEPEIKALLNELERHKSTLELVLELINLQSTNETRNSLYEVQEKLNLLEYRTRPADPESPRSYPSMNSTRNAVSVDIPRTNESVIWASSRSSIDTFMRYSGSSFATSLIGTAYEEVLRTARPYKIRTLWGNRQRNLADSASAASTSERKYRWSWGGGHTTASEWSPAHEASNPLRAFSFKPYDNTDFMPYPFTTTSQDGGKPASYIPADKPVYLGRHVSSHNKPSLHRDFHPASPQHCQIWWRMNEGDRETQWYIRDLDSKTGGTFLNDRKIEPNKDVRLKDGDTVRLGWDCMRGGSTFRCAVKLRLSVGGCELRTVQEDKKMDAQTKRNSLRWMISRRSAP